MITLTLQLDEATKALATLEEKLGNLTPVMEDMRDLALDAVDRNFAAGGRPPWVPLRPPRTGRPLEGSGTLRASITAEVTATSVTLSSDLPYSAIHQYGGTVHIPEMVAAPYKAFRFVTAAGEVVFTRRVRAHDVIIPARPYLTVTQGDLDIMAAVAESYLRPNTNT